MTAGQGDFGIAPRTLVKLRQAFEAVPGIDRVWIFGSRARGTQRPESDIDLAVETVVDRKRIMSELSQNIEGLGLMYRVDLLNMQDTLDDKFRSLIERDRRVFWEPRRHPAQADALGSITLKKFQQGALDALGRYLTELKHQETRAATKQSELRVMEDMQEEWLQAGDYPKKAWAALKAAGTLPPAYAELPYSSRFDGAGNAIPNVCLKVPTGGGKTLLAAAAVGQVFSGWLQRHTGLVLWVVPNEAIYRQTLKALNQRDHPYRQMLTLAGAGRVKVLEKNSPLSRLDIESNLCVMLLMLQSAARVSKETLRFFRDRGNVLGFLPREDDIEAHWELLGRVPNLDVYRSPWQSADEARAQKGSIVKSSLGNVMRLLRPMVVIDEGHHGYSENALRTIDGFNPSFLLELSATPRRADGKAGSSGSNILVDVRGTDLDEAEMIKLPIDVEVRRWADWQSCLAASVQRLNGLQIEASALQTETSRYIRPILLVQVERTGADMRDAGFIHAEDARAFLLQLGFTPAQIAVKTSDKNELQTPENIDLLSPQCEVRAIITKQALQEGWDCPFAYVLCALAAGRSLDAMTQLVGRILRLPQVAKTGRPALDGCYVLCHDAHTAAVVKGIKKSLEQEGMGDLAMVVRGESGEVTTAQRVALTRRPGFAGLRIFLPRVTCVQADGRRRLMAYESDVLAMLPWQQMRADTLAANWAPDLQAVMATHLSLDLSLLNRSAVAATAGVMDGTARVDRALLVRSLIDLAPNAWWVWEWVSAVLSRLLAGGMPEARIAASSATLLEHLRIDLEAERDRLAQSVFEEGVASGRIQFRLCADTHDYELGLDDFVMLQGDAHPLMRSDHQAVQKSLLTPALTAGLNEFEVQFAGYLDERAALRWWHRNVAKSQYALQGWKRHRVYPDFVFAKSSADGSMRLVLMETKGAFLANEDTAYKQALMQKLAGAWQDHRLSRAGDLALEDGGQFTLECDLVFDQGWRGTLDKNHFGEA